VGRLRKQGVIECVGRGLYALPDAVLTEKHSLAEASRRVPGGVPVKVFSAARTVADCFKLGNKIGIHVAVEALREFSRAHRDGATALARFARICRVTRVMQPYLDAIG
jgi:predicted transcriptional regulator of viral defense system